MSPKSSSTARRGARASSVRRPGRSMITPLPPPSGRPAHGGLERHRAREPQHVAHRRARVVVGPHAAAAERRAARGRVDGDHREQAGAAPAADEQRLVVEGLQVAVDGRASLAGAHGAAPRAGEARVGSTARRAGRRGCAAPGPPGGSGAAVPPASVAASGRPPDRRRRRVRPGDGRRARSGRGRRAPSSTGVVGAPDAAGASDVSDAGSAPAASIGSRRRLLGGRRAASRVVAAAVAAPALAGAAWTPAPWSTPRWAGAGRGGRRAASAAWRGRRRAASAARWRRGARGGAVAASRG